MAQLDKLKRSFKACSGSYPFRDFVRMAEAMGYELLQTGRTGGSRRRYMNKASGHTLFMDEPHDGEMKPGMVRRLREELEGRSAL